MTAPLVVHNVKVHFATPRGTVRALDGVSFSLDRGEIVGVVGESGCGKSTLAKTIVGLQRPSSGSVEIDGNDLLAARAGSCCKSAGRSRWCSRIPLVP